MLWAFSEYCSFVTLYLCAGVGATGVAVVSAMQGVASITIQGSNDPHGVLQFAPTSLAVNISEDASYVSLQVDRKFGAIGE